jgi:pseudo-rSAM protein
MNNIYKGKHYFYFEYYTYIKINGTSVFLLNTLDSQRIISNDKRIISLIESLLGKKNNVLEIDFDNVYTDDIYQLFFDEIRNKYMGDLIAVGLSKSEPVNFYPIGKIENNIREKKDKTSVDYNLLCNSLFNLSIFLNTECTHNCLDCRNYYKQFHCCSKFSDKNDNNSIDANVVEKIFKYAKFENLHRINILGGNISLYKDMDSVLNYLCDYKEICYAFFKYNNISSINEQICSFFNNRIIIIVDASEIDENDIDVLFDKYNKFEIHFIVTVETQIEKLMRFVDSEISHKFIPFFNGKNLAFFENNIFLNEEDIFETNYTIKKIHKNQHINSIFFGNLTVLPNADICVDVNGNVLGNLNSESMFDIISKSLKNEDSLWFRTRKMTTCSDCLFVDLCPPPSNYEIVIGRSNLCHVKRDD